MSKARTAEPQIGRPHPLGAEVRNNGVGFCVLSQSAALVELLLYDEADSDVPARVIKLDPKKHRTNDYWHVFVPGIKAGQFYAFRVHGRFDPEEGYWFDGDKVLLDPYGKAIEVPKAYDREAASKPGKNDRQACKSVVVGPSTYDWEGDAPLRRPFAQTVIYEMHVGGFTRHPNSGIAADKRGTFAGVIEKIPYLVDLGITAVELMPVFHFDEQDTPSEQSNYWGYAPMSFFAPHRGYSSNPDALAVIDEFRDMVKALHKAGIEVILDVVYNHTAEGGADGPTFCLRGFHNRGYYLTHDHGKTFANYSGTGNVLNPGHAIVRRLIIDSLHYWREEMHVDGFRFDLASILSRGSKGSEMANPPMVWDIDTDPVLAGSKLIVEAWDAGGLYQVGSFVGNYWKEWNGMFRDDVRRFLRGDKGMVKTLCTRLLGSPDLYGSSHREAERSINFVTAHDGFTLNDLVSYNHKHNKANGEDNRDGMNENFSSNYGQEGPSNIPELEALRERQIRNAFAMTLLSLGAPMICMGDEARRTQHGNNNAYCQDSELSWMDWDLVEKHADLRRFVRSLVGLRAMRNAVRTGERVDLMELHARANLQFHGVRVGEPDWSHESHSLALTATTLSGHLHLYFAGNMYWEPLDFELPEPPSGLPWHRALDTSLAAPNDICDDIASAPTVSDSHYQVGPQSVVVLVAFAIASDGVASTARAPGA